MKKFSFSWKVFLVVNYVQMIIYLLLCASVIMVMVTGKQSEAELQFVTILFAIGLLLIAINSSINVHALHRYFPDKSFPSKNKTLLIIFWIINLLLYAGLAYIIYVGYKDEFNNNDYPRQRNNIGTYTVILLFITWLMGVFILIGQLQIPQYLGINNKKKMAILIDSIGENKQD